MSKKRELNYGDLPLKYSNKNNSKVIIIPVPYDETSTWIKGADSGPSSIIEASANMELYDIETNSEVFKQGIYTDNYVTEKSSPEKMVEAVEKKVNNFIKKDKFIVLIGGEHSVSIGSIIAHSKRYKGLCVLQLDAHADLRDSYQGSKYSHACVMSRAKEYCSVVQVGIRSMDISEKKALNKKKVFFAEQIRNDKGWMDKIVNNLSSKVYLTLDLDVFDPSIMPSTGTPESGGLYWYEVLKLLKKVIEKKELVGFDVVELCPNKNSKAPDFLAAKLIYKILSYKFKK
jgi:agmatinase